MDQKTANEILGKLGGLVAEVRHLVDTSKSFEAKLDELKGALTARVHNVNNDLTILKGSVGHLTTRLDGVEPDVETLKEHYLRNAGAMAVGKVVWLLIVSGITAVITSLVTVIAQHYIHA